ncbi:MAG: MFS transporter [Phycisphaerales bacterium]|nr:MFS transporter [Phycisphaerales bacterium]
MKGRVVKGQGPSIEPPCDLTCEYPAGRGKAWLFWALPAFFFLYEFMLRVSPSVVAPQLTTEFHANAAEFGFSMGLYYYAYAPMQLVVGIMLDRFGSRRPLAIAALICAAGAAVFAVAHSLEMAGAGRLLAGIGSAFAYVGTIYVASVWFPRSRLALIAGVTAALGMAGAVAGEVVLEWIEDVVTWRQSFWGFAIAGVVLGVGMWLLVPKRPRWFEEVSRKSRTHDGVFHGLGCVLRSRRTWALSCVAGLLYLPVGVFGALWGNWFLEDGLDIASPADADAMLFVGLGIAAPVLGWVSDRFERPRLVLQVGIGAAFAATVLLLLLTPAQKWAAIPLLLVLGLGVGSIVVAFPMAMHLNPHHARGTAITFINFSQMLLVGVGQWLIGVFLDADAHVAHHAAKVVGPDSFSLNDFRVAFLVLPIGLVVAFLFTWMLREGVEHQA